MKKRLARFKIYTERSKWYFAYLQFIMIFAVWLDGIGFTVSWWMYPFIIVGSVAFFIVAGYFEVKSGMLKHEQEKYIAENPGFDRIFKELKEIKESIK
jgi:hypothetical protein